MVTKAFPPQQIPPTASFSEFCDTLPLITGERDLAIINTETSLYSIPPPIEHNRRDLFELIESMEAAVNAEAALSETETIPAAPRPPSGIVLSKDLHPQLPKPVEDEITTRRKADTARSPEHVQSAASHTAPSRRSTKAPPTEAPSQAPAKRKKSKRSKKTSRKVSIHTWTNLTETAKKNVKDHYANTHFIGKDDFISYIKEHFSLSIPTSRCYYTIRCVLKKAVLKTAWHLSEDQLAKANVALKGRKFSPLKIEKLVTSAIASAKGKSKKNIDFHKVFKGNIQGLPEANSPSD